MARYSTGIGLTKTAHGTMSTKSTPKHLSHTSARNKTMHDRRGTATPAHHAGASLPRTSPKEVKGSTMTVKIPNGNSRVTQRQLTCYHTASHVLPHSNSRVTQRHLTCDPHS